MQAFNTESIVRSVCNLDPIYRGKEIHSHPASLPDSTLFSPGQIRNIMMFAPRLISSAGTSSPMPTSAQSEPKQPDTPRPK
ncbi:unnamed protein product [Caenorhabditis sp. 36 PRJEB53466]|nr:unnamed protein product [Caenorhabditis sp. 36 PRJEB53466]